MAKLSFNAVAGEIVDENQTYEFSIFRSLADPCPKTITLAEFAEMIQGGEFCDEIQRLRAEPDEDKQKQIKRTLPCVTVSGVFSGGHNSTNLSHHSGLICIDFDADQNSSLEGCADQWRDKLASDEFVKHAFVSARGNGVAAICRIEADNHAQAFDALAVYFKKTHGLNVDKACRDVTRLRFVSWDDGITENKNSRVFKRYSLAEEVKPEPQRKESQSEAVDVALTKARKNEILSALEVLSPDSRKAWLDVGMAINSECPRLEGFNMWRMWSEFNDCANKFNESDLARVWASFGRRGGVHIETLFSMAYKAGWMGAPVEREQTGALPVMVASEWVKTKSVPRDPVIEDVFDQGTFVEVIAPSKCKKSFFVMQMANCISAGIKFIAWNVPRRRRVLLINVELLADRAHDRQTFMMRPLNLSGDDIDHLLVANIKGLDLPDAVGSICKTIKAHKPEVCIIDPLYLIHGEDENDQKAMTVVFKRLSTVQVETKCTLVVVHHDAKGKAGDRDKRDRGSGSGVMARFSDSRILLTPHKENEDMVCIDAMCRYVKPHPGVVACFSDGCFVESEAEYAPDTSAKTKTVKKGVVIAYVAAWLANEIITSGPYTCGAMAQKIGSKKTGGNGMLSSKGLHSKCWDALKKIADESKTFAYVMRGNAMWFGTEEKLREMCAPKQYVEG